MPKEVCGYASMEKLNCYHNVIKTIPDAIVQLQALTYLNLRYISVLQIRRDKRDNFPYYSF